MARDKGIKPILTGIWNERRRFCKMFHGVSSFRRLHTAFLNVLQSGAYASSPIFHQPCDTTIRPDGHPFLGTRVGRLEYDNRSLTLPPIDLDPEVAQLVFRVDDLAVMNNSG